MTSSINYFLIGHISKDLHAGGNRIGGGVTFGSLTAHALGCKTSILTSYASTDRDLLSPLKDISVHHIPSEATTTFDNVYTPSGRKQTLHHRATVLESKHLPSDISEASIIHLTPIADEFSPDLFDPILKAGKTIITTPQGFMRQWDSSGVVTYKPWSDQEKILPLVSALILSMEDVGGDQKIIDKFSQRARLVVVTEASEGCKVYVNNQIIHLPAPAVNEVDPTGAGDVFATSFAIRYYETGDPIQSARFANRIASISIGMPGVTGIPSLEEIEDIKRELGT